MKKIMLRFCIAGLIMLALAACGNDKKGKTPEDMTREEIIAQYEALAVACEAVAAQETVSAEEYRKMEKDVEAFAPLVQALQSKGPTVHDVQLMLNISTRVLESLSQAKAKARLAE